MYPKRIASNAISNKNYTNIAEPTLMGRKRHENWNEKIRWYHFFARYFKDWECLCHTTKCVERFFIQKIPTQIRISVWLWASNFAPAQKLVRLTMNREMERELRLIDNDSSKKLSVLQCKIHIKVAILIEFSNVASLKEWCEMAIF